MSKSILPLLLTAMMLVASSCSRKVTVESASVSFGDVPLGSEGSELVYRRHENGRVESRETRVTASFRISESVETGEGLAEGFLVFKFQPADGSDPANLRCVCKIVGQSISCFNSTLVGEIPESFADFDGQVTVTLDGVKSGDTPVEVELLHQPIKMRFLTVGTKLRELNDQNERGNPAPNPDELPAESPNP